MSAPFSSGRILHPGAAPARRQIAHGSALFVSLMGAVSGAQAQGAAQIPGARVVFATLALLAGIMFVASLVALRGHGRS